ncbi:MAG: tripartite tricarboxylate transporter substrate binding protein [Hyphomicrobiales bacterium]|nr:tripartite tricarboxylate transporter substrate binding protein [Hyphomicrobiales bacterium]
MLDRIRASVRRAGGRSAAAATLLAAALLPGFQGAAVAAYPEKPVTLVVPYKAGGSTETMARVYAKALQEQLGQPVIVSTRPGGGGAVGATVVAKAAPDGYTMLFAAASALVWPPMTQKVEYGPDSFRWVASITEYQQALITTPDKPYKTYPELIAYAKAHPGMNFADQNALSRSFIKYIGKKEGVTWTAIPTKGGGEMVPFLLGGKVDIAWSGGVHQKFGDKMHVLASFNPKRLGQSPDAPSLKEIYGIAMPSYAVIVVPKDTPDDVVATLEKALKEASKDKAFDDMVTNKLKFPNQFIGSEELKPLVADMVTGLKTVLEETRN